MVAVHRLGEGRFVLDSLLIRETPGRSPVAGRLLRNMLSYAARGCAMPPGEPRPDFVETPGLKQGRGM